MKRLCTLVACFPNKEVRLWFDRQSRHYWADGFGLRIVILKSIGELIVQAGVICNSGRKKCTKLLVCTTGILKGMPLKPHQPANLVVLTFRGTGRSVPSHGTTTFLPGKQPQKRHKKDLRDDQGLLQPENAPLQLSAFKRRKRLEPAHLGKKWHCNFKQFSLVRKEEKPDTSIIFLRPLYNSFLPKKPVCKQIPLPACIFKMKR